jgi:hypothetical protein
MEAIMWQAAACFLSRGNRREPEKEWGEQVGRGERKEVLSSFPVILTSNQYLMDLLKECSSVKDKASATERSRCFQSLKTVQLLTWRKH